jgi:hypothetical protein
VTDDVAGPPRYDHLYLGARQPDGLMVEVVYALTCTTEGLMDATNSCAPPSDPSAHRGSRYLAVEQRRRRGPAVPAHGSLGPQLTTKQPLFGRNRSPRSLRRRTDVLR